MFGDRCQVFTVSPVGLCTHREARLFKYLGYAIYKPQTALDVVVITRYMVQFLYEWINTTLFPQISLIVILSKMLLLFLHIIPRKKTPREVFCSTRTPEEITKQKPWVRRTKGFCLGDFWGGSGWTKYQTSVVFIFIPWFLEFISSWGTIPAFILPST